MKPPCWLIGHRFQGYDVRGFRPMSDDISIWTNDRCRRCGAFRNPLIGIEQQALIAFGREVVVTMEPAP